MTPTRTGRPRVGPVFDFHMPLRQRERVAAVAAARSLEEGRTVPDAEIIREAIDFALPRLEEEAGIV